MRTTPAEVEKVLQALQAWPGYYSPGFAGAAVSETFSLIVTDTSPLFILVLAYSPDVLLRPGLPVSIPDADYIEATRAHGAPLSMNGQVLSAPAIFCVSLRVPASSNQVISSSIRLPPKAATSSGSARPARIPRRENGFVQSFAALAANLDADRRHASICPNNVLPRRRTTAYNPTSPSMGSSGSTVTPAVRA
jgi:hypothetical protein